jgi:hypothetical protein
VEVSLRCFALLSAALALSVWSAFAPPAEAGGPLRFSAAGPIVWETANPIKFHIDRGNLGPIDATTIQATIKTAFKTWSDVATAAIKFQFDGLLDDDVATVADYMIATNNETGGNVVILDDDGDIVADIFGEGNRTRILGFASPIDDGTHIIAFLSLMNGRLADSADTFLSTLVHEFGHAIGLDHTQIQAALAGDGNKANDRFIPTMFPTDSDDDTQLATVNPDDIAWVSFLYPSPTFSTKFGRIRGGLVRPNNGGPVLGANVIAVLQSTVPEDGRMFQFSCVSDFLAQNNGEFVIPVAPGQYRLHIEPILRGFTKGSSVGPHSETATSPSFVNPVDPSDLPNVITVTAGGEVNVGTVTAD